VIGVQTVDDGMAMIEALAGARKVVVVGSGYIGLEMAEACVRRGLDTTVVDRNPMPLRLIEPVLGAMVATAMADLGIRLVPDAEVIRFRLGDDGAVVAVETDAGEYRADVVLLGLGVRARTQLAEKAGLPLGRKGGIVVDAHQRVEGFDDVWSAGDCVVTRDRITGELIHLPLGTHANKQGLVLAANLADVLRGDAPTREFPGVVRTAVTKICSLEIGRTGLRERDARKEGFDPVMVWIDTTTSAGYMPDAGQLTVLMVADRISRAVLGVQVVGAEDSALRIDAAAMALWSGLTVDELMMTDLAYAPPFSSVWSPIQVAARAAIREMDG
jgi:NADPH-dependent 2,4-dienoyl-CoA reductase/sulfur reductase-like enzyme